MRCAYGTPDVRPGHVYKSREKLEAHCDRQLEVNALPIPLLRPAAVAIASLCVVLETAFMSACRTSDEITDMSTTSICSGRWVARGGGGLELVSARYS